MSKLTFEKVKNRCPYCKIQMKSIYCWDGVKYECPKCKYWCLV